LTVANQKHTDKKFFIENVLVKQKYKPDKKKSKHKNAKNSEKTEEIAIRTKRN